MAILTPFRADGRIDFAALGDYLDLLNAAGVQTILANGTTAEFASLTGTERCALVEYCRSRWHGVLIAHIGSTAIGDAAALARHAHAHADWLAAINPYFFAAAPEAGIEQYFAELLAISQLPTLLYNFPRHTQNPLNPDLVARLAIRFPQLRGIKDSGKDLAVTRAWKTRCPDLQVFLSDDRLGAQVAQIGLDGVVTGAGGPVAETTGRHCRGHPRRRRRASRTPAAMFRPLQRGPKVLPRHRHRVREIGSRGTHSRISLVYAAAAVSHHT
ncbi:dihydrodipicolinate synthase family protein [Nocardia brasiliensis]|uniref:dihydrodipicolinate synthase family protein n=1 Tax=Nocardia brasiliensis TaxID=37326 RepID=UPI002457B652|nr:dihydrodipicolinate synthase family protein [Nocardia brasiliensis]